MMKTSVAFSADILSQRQAAAVLIRIDMRNRDECWPWTGFRNGQGYGNFSAKIRDRVLTVVAHRFAYAFWREAIPENTFVCHSCDNPSCCNPHHLWLGTHDDNIADRQAKGRNVNKRGSANGMSKLTEPDVLAIRADRRLLREIACQYGISIGQTSHIRRREVWKHL